MHHLNTDACTFEYDDTDPAGYRCGAVRVGAVLAAQETAIKLFEIPSGESVCPYHYEYTEEWLYVIEGEVAVRTPEGEQRAATGALLRFPSGPDGGHKVTNRAARPARVMMFSSSREPAVTVYPDSDKIGVWPGDDRDTVMLRRADGNVPCYDGEA